MHLLTLDLAEQIIKKVRQVWILVHQFFKCPKSYFLSQYLFQVEEEKEHLGKLSELVLWYDRLHLLLLILWNLWETMQIITSYGESRKKVIFVWMKLIINVAFDLVWIHFLISLLPCPLFFLNIDRAFDADVYLFTVIYLMKRIPKCYWFDMTAGLCLTLALTTAYWHRRYKCLP